MIRDSFEAPYIRLYFGERELTQKVEKFMYTYDEENDDEISLDLRLEDPTDVDKPEFQEKAELSLIWGFIQGETSEVRKIHIRNAAPAYRKEGITITLTCTEKGTTLKQSTERSIYKGDSLIKIAADKAQKHGLTLEIHPPNSQGVPFTLSAKQDESVQDYISRYEAEKIRREHEAYKKKVNDNPNLKALFEKPIVQIPPDQIRKNQEASASRPIDNPFKSIRTAKTILDLYDAYYNIENVKNIPQALLSDMQLLKKLGGRVQGDGGAIIETRDNRLIVRKRNFNQTPYKSYTYRGGTGELIDFVPETKNRSQAAKGTGQGYSGWNGLNKNFYSGTADPANDPSNPPSLTNWLRIMKQWQDIQDRTGGKGDPIVAYRTKPGTDRVIGRDFDPLTGGEVNSQPRPVTKPIPLSIGLKALKEAVGKFQEEKAQKKKDIYSSVYGGNPGGAFTDASNRRSKAELESNPATMQVWGDPKLVVGILITIVNVGKKHSGNYYVVRATHTIDTGMGYITELELRKHGHNIKSSDEHVQARDIKRTVNKVQGPEENKQSTRTLKIKR